MSATDEIESYPMARSRHAALRGPWRHSRVIHMDIHRLRPGVVHQARLDREAPTARGPKMTALVWFYLGVLAGFFLAGLLCMARDEESRS